MPRGMAMFMVMGRGRNHVKTLYYNITRVYRPALTDD
jgi:hypothetical protein